MNPDCTETEQCSLLAYAGIYHIYTRCRQGYYYNMVGAGATTPPRHTQQYHIDPWQTLIPI